MPVLSNTRHENFAQAVAAGKTATEAYVLAGYKSHDGNAATLRGNKRVTARIAEIVGKAAKRVEADRSWVIERLMRNASICLGDEKVKIAYKPKGLDTTIELEVTARDAAGANRSLELVGKEIGMFKEKIEHSGTLTLAQLVEGSYKKDGEK